MCRSEVNRSDVPLLASVASWWSPKFSSQILNIYEFESNFCRFATARCCACFLFVFTVKIKITCKRQIRLIFIIWGVFSPNYNVSDESYYFISYLEIKRKSEQNLEIFWKTNDSNCFSSVVMLKKSLFAEQGYPLITIPVTTIMVAPSMEHIGSTGFIFSYIMRGNEIYKSKYKINAMVSQ